MNQFIMFHGMKSAYSQNIGKENPRDSICMQWGTRSTSPLCGADRQPWYLLKLHIVDGAVLRLLRNVPYRYCL